jgi:PKD domain/Beta-propeller repeat
MKNVIHRLYCVFCICLCGLQLHAVAGYSNWPEQSTLRFNENTDANAAKYPYYSQFKGLSIAFASNHIDHFLWDEKGNTCATISYLLVGSNPHSKPVGFGEFQDKTTYHLETGTRRQKSFSGIRYNEIYPGIHLVFYSVDGEMKFDFELEEGADHCLIQMQIEGADSISLADGGSLKIHHRFGEMEEFAPSSFYAEGRRDIGSQYRLSGNIVSFDLESHERDAKRVIDPPRRWSLLYGGSGFDYAKGIAVDAANGDVVFAGYSTSNNFPSTATNGSGGQHNGFIVKTDSLGNRLWALVIGGPGDDFIYDVSIDPSGNILVCGKADAGFPFTNSSQAGGNGDAFLAKISSAGTLLWAIGIGGSGLDQAKAVANDDQGIAYVCGTSGSSNFPSTNSTYAGSLEDAFAMRFDSNGNVLNSILFGGQSFDYANDISVVPNGSEFYVVGETGSLDFPVTSSAFAGSGGPKAFAAKFSSGGVRQFSYKIGGSNTERAFGSAWDDQSGRLLVSGFTDSPDFPVSMTSPSGTLQDAFVLRIRPNGQPDWATRLGGTGNEFANGVAVDDSGSIFIVGASDSQDYPQTTGIYSSSGSDVILTKLDSMGNIRWSVRYGGTQADIGSAIAVQSPQVYFAGHAQNTTFPATINTYQGSGTEAFAANFQDCIGMRARFSVSNACVSDSLLFQNTSIAGTSEIDEFYWNFGDGTNGTHENPAHLFAAAGDYLVKLVITNGCGLRDSTVDTVHVFPMPIASFSHQDSCLFDSLQLVSNSSVAPLFQSSINGWTWQLDGQNPQSGQQSAYFNAVSDTVMVSLVVSTIYGCLDSVARNISIPPLPVPLIEVVDVCFPEPLVWTDSSTISLGSLVSRKWLTDSLVVGASQQYIWVPADTGSYTLGLEVISDAGCKDTAWADARVEPKPSAGFAGADVCFPEASAIVDLSNGNGGVIVSWAYSFSDGGMSSQPSPAHAFPIPGGYSAQQIVTTAFGCRDTLIDSLWVRHKPNASFVSDSVCLGETTHFINQSTIVVDSIVQYYWTFGSGSHDSVPDPSFAFQSPGQHWVGFSVSSNYGCSDTVSATAIVWELPVVELEILEGASDLCIGDSVTIGIVDLFPSYIWSNAATTQQITVGQGGTYSLSVLDGNTCSSMDSLEVTYHQVPAPAPGISPFGPVNVCFGDTAFLDAGLGYQRYQWSSGDTVRVISPLSDGMFMVTVTNGFGCVGVSEAVNVTYLAAVPLPFITQVGDTLFASSGIAWQWYVDQQAIQPATNLWWQPQQSGAYTVEVMDSNGCVQLSEPFTILVGLEDSEIQNLKVWPNPMAQGDLLNFSGVTGVFSLQVLDLQGRKMLDHQFRTSEPIQVPMDLPVGYYILLVRTAARTYSSPILVR